MAPNWARLADAAVLQGGYFTLKQAQLCGVSQPLLAYWREQGKIRWVFRGMFRLANHRKAGVFESVQPYWVWSQGECVFSHQTALVLHGVWPGAIPDEVFATVSPGALKRRVMPGRLVAYRTDVPAEERVKLGPFSVEGTTILRAVYDLVEVAEHEREYALPHPRLVEIVDRVRASKKVSPEDMREVEASVARIAPKTSDRR